jgi:hypothetical protein
MGGVALAVSIAGAVVDRAAFFEAWLASWLFVLGIALGSLVLLAIHELTGGDWGAVLGPQLDAAALTLPLVALLGVPLAFGLDVFPWTHADVVAMSAAVAAKHWYLNVPAFLARNAAALVVWSALALALCRPARVPRRAAVVALLVYFVTVTFAAVDWVASLVPEWYSSAIGIELGALQLVSAFAFVVSLTLMRRATVTPRQLHDLGNLLLTLVMTWAYFRVRAIPRRMGRRPAARDELVLGANADELALPRDRHRCRHIRTARRGAALSRHQAEPHWTGSRVRHRARRRVVLHVLAHRSQLAARGIRAALAGHRRAARRGRPLARRCCARCAAEPSPRARHRGVDACLTDALQRRSMRTCPTRSMCGRSLRDCWPSSRRSAPACWPPSCCCASRATPRIRRR